MTQYVSTKLGKSEYVVRPADAQVQVLSQPTTHNGSEGNAVPRALVVVRDAVAVEVIL